MSAQTQLRTPAEYKALKLKPSTRSAAERAALLRTDAGQNQLAREQYVEGIDNGFVDPPKFDIQELGLARRNLFESLGVFCEVLNKEPVAEFPYEVTGRDRVLADWAKSCSETGEDKYRNVHALRRNVSDEVWRIGLLYESWEKAGINIFSDDVIAEYKTLSAVVRDPRAFVMAAALSEIFERRPQDKVETGRVDKIFAAFRQTDPDSPQMATLREHYVRRFWDIQRAPA